MNVNVGVCNKCNAKIGPGAKLLGETWRWMDLLLVDGQFEMARPNEKIELWTMTEECRDEWGTHLQSKMRVPFSRLDNGWH